MDWGSEGLFARHLEASRDFLDIGANVGYYSMYCAPLVRRVVSFDPDPRNHVALEENRLRANNISIQKMALGGTPGDGILEMQADSAVSRLAEGSQALGTTLRVAVSTIDAFLAEDKTLNLGAIKLDTEGTELEILRGGQSAIAQWQPLILAELQRNPGEGEKQALEFQEFSAAMGYRLFAYVPIHSGVFHTESFYLVALDSTTFKRNSTKMIFLVPPRLQCEFEAETNRNQSVAPSSDLL